MRDIIRSRRTVRRSVVMVVAAAALLASRPARLDAQRGRGAQTPATPRASAPMDLTGYWVSVVTEDWRFRMVTPPKGQYGGVPLNAEGRRVADGWDPAKDEAAGEPCKAYGAAAIMRVPGRLHITWDNDNTLRIDTDAGTQTRLIRFGESPSQGGEPTWQGDSAAQWELARAAQGEGGRGQVRRGGLKVVTTQMRPGYLRKNGVPYSSNAVLTEYYDRHTPPNGDEWLVVTTVVEDARYLTQGFVTSSHFKKLHDASGWNPEPCSAR